MSENFKTNSDGEIHKSASATSSLELDKQNAKSESKPGRKR